MKLRSPRPATMLITVFFKSNFPRIKSRDEEILWQIGGVSDWLASRNNFNFLVFLPQFSSIRSISSLFPLLTRAPLHDDHELDSESFVQSSSPLLVKMGVSKIPTKWIQYSEVVPAHNHNKYYHFSNNRINDSEIFQLELGANIIFKVNSKLELKQACVFLLQEFYEKL